MIYIMLMDFKERWRRIFIIPILVLCILLIFKIFSLLINIPVIMSVDRLYNIAEALPGVLGLKGIHFENGFFGLWIFFITYFPVLYMYHQCRDTINLFVEDDEFQNITFLQDIIGLKINIIFSKYLVQTLFYFMEMIICTIITFILIIIFNIEMCNFETFSIVFRSYMIIMLVGHIFSALGLLYGVKKEKGLTASDFSLLIIILSIFIGRVESFMDLLVEVLIERKTNINIDSIKYLTKKIEFLKYISPVSWCGFGNIPNISYILVGILSFTLLFVYATIVYKNREV